MDKGTRASGRIPRGVIALAITVGVRLTSDLAWAGSIGGGLDAFLGTWQAWCLGLGIFFFITGAAGWFLSKMGMFHAPVLDGAMNLIVPAGVFGAILTIAGGLGLAAGGTLPL